MKLLIDINHPAHVHLFKHFAWLMEKKGHTILFTARKKEVAIDLLDACRFNYRYFGRHYKTLPGKFWGILKFDLKLLFTALQFKPDLFLSMGGIYPSHVAFLLRKPHIAMDDTEHMKDHHILYVPFTDVCLNPSCFHKSFGKKQVFYKGYHELAYLHPKRFTPDPGIKKILGVSENERYAIVRFVSWAASHDIGQKGMTLDVKRALIRELSPYVRVFISSESDLPEEFMKYKIRIPPDKMHDALAYASLFIGEGSTMASECACLGTPAVYINSLEVGYCTEEEKYGLVYNFRNTNGVLEKIIELVRTENLAETCRAKRLKMLSEKIDVTAFLVWFVENYPDSADVMKKLPDFDKRFITGAHDKPVADEAAR